MVSLASPELTFGNKKPSSKRRRLSEVQESISDAAKGRQRLGGIAHLRNAAERNTSSRHAAERNASSRVLQFLMDEFLF